MTGQSQTCQCHPERGRNNPSRRLTLRECPGESLTRGMFDVLPRAQRARRERNGTRARSCLLRSSSEGAAGARATRSSPLP
eukprot:9874141-Alexandrium_andersonii.AAC.1